MAIPGVPTFTAHDRRLVVALASLAGTAVAIGFAVDAAVGDTQAWPLYLLASAGGAGEGVRLTVVEPGADGGCCAGGRAVPATIALNFDLAELERHRAGDRRPVLHKRRELPAVRRGGVATATTAVLVLFVSLYIGTAHVDDELADATLTDALAGVRLIAANRALLGAISLYLRGVLFGGATALLPAFAQEVLHVGSGGYGVLRAAPGVGAVIVGALLAACPLRRRVGPTLMIAVARFGGA